MTSWILIEARVDHNSNFYPLGSISHTNNYGMPSISKFVDSYGGPSLSLTFRHMNSGMVKRYENVPMTPAIDMAFRDMSWDDLQYMLPEALEEGFVAIENRNGIVHCSRNVLACNSECCLFRKCELGTMKKMVEREG